MSDRSCSKSSNSSQKKVSSVSSKNSVVGVFISVATSSAWIENLEEKFNYYLTRIVITTLSGASV